MKIIGKYWKLFVFRGLVAMGLGPLCLAAVYGILDLCGVTNTVSVGEMTLEIFTVTALAFFCGATTQVFQIEELAISKAITLHGIVLYLAYAVVYLTNGWIERRLIPFLVFTGVFVVGYAIIWVIIFFVTKKNTEKVNKNLKK